MIRRRPDRLVGFAWIHPRRDAGVVRDLLDDALGHGLVGIKVHGHEGSPGREVLDAAAERQLPILVDVVGRPHAIDLFAPAYRQVVFIIPHLGSFADDWRAHQTVIDAIGRHPNVYADTSGVRRFDYLVSAVRHAGPHKLIFGSDGPWLHPALELHKVRLLGLAPRTEALVLGGTLRRILADVGTVGRDVSRRGARRTLRSHPSVR